MTGALSTHSPNNKKGSNRQARKKAVSFRSEEEEASLLKNETGKKGEKPGNGERDLNNNHSSKGRKERGESGKVRHRD